jgi:hypothetical protein
VGKEEKQVASRSGKKRDSHQGNGEKHVALLLEVCFLRIVFDIRCKWRGGSYQRGGHRGFTLYVWKGRHAHERRFGNLLVNKIYR